MSRLRCHKLDSISSICLLGGKMPALLTTMSSPPNVRTTSSTAPASTSELVTSHSRPIRVFLLNSVLTCGLISSPTSAAPCASSISAHALPIPLAAPVTSATLPASGGGLPPRLSLACSSSQYSTSNRSFSGSVFHSPSASAHC